MHFEHAPLETPILLLSKLVDVWLITLGATTYKVKVNKWWSRSYVHMPIFLISRTIGPILFKPVYVRLMTWALQCISSGSMDEGQGHNRILSKSRGLASRLLSKLNDWWPWAKAGGCTTKNLWQCRVKSQGQWLKVKVIPILSMYPDNKTSYFDVSWLYSKQRFKVSGCMHIVRDFRE